LPASGAATAPASSGTARAVRRAADRLDSAAGEEPDSIPRRPRARRGRAGRDRSEAARRCGRGPCAWVDSARLAAALWALHLVWAELLRRVFEIDVLKCPTDHPRRVICEAVPEGRERSAGAEGPSASAAARWTDSRGVDVTPRGDIAREASLAYPPG
jgi:hypothetical protein